MDSAGESVGLFHASSNVAVATAAAAAAYRQYALQQMMPLMDGASAGSTLSKAAEEGGEVLRRDGETGDKPGEDVKQHTATTTVNYGKGSGRAPSSMLKKVRRRRTAFTQVTQFVPLIFFHHFQFAF